MSSETLHSSENSPAIWIILLALLVIGGLVAAGSMTLLHVNQQGEQPTGSQSTPSK